MTANRRIPTDIEQHRFDVIIIGAGINGAGIARDAAMRGLDVLLLEKHDIGSGTTPWSTRLIHGGLRYLEHGELGLVRESLRERRTLLKIAPHLVEPLPFLLPVFGWQRRGLQTIRGGMIAYDLLSVGKQLPRHRILSKKQALEHTSGLSSTDLRGGAIYYDAQVAFPERLALENVIDARRYGATIITRAEAEKIDVTDEVATGVDVRCTLTGERFRARARTIVNAAGPWVDHLLGEIEPKPLIGGTLGSHIVVDTFAGAPKVAVYSEARDDGRPFFVIPWLDRLLIGTTDIPFSGDPETLRPTLPEVDYLLAQTSAIFPDSGLTRESVLFGYTGVRPLPVAGGRTAGAITRRHMIRHHAPTADGVYSIIGGKLTTYRSLAQQATDVICRRTGHGDPCRTAELLLPGAGSRVDAERQLRHAGVSNTTIARMKSIYGSRLSEIARIVDTDPTLARSTDAVEPAINAEIIHAFQNEFATTMADALLRRTMLGLSTGGGMQFIEPALSVARSHLGWDTARIEDERRSYNVEASRLRIG